MPAWLSQWLRPLSPIWWGLIISTGILFLLWSVSRMTLAILKRYARSRGELTRVGQTEYVTGVFWDLTRAGLWLWIAFCVICEAMSGRIGPGMFHGPMYRSHGPLLFYLLEAFFLLISLSFVATAMSSLRRRRALHQQGVIKVDGAEEPG
jgi:hypothetical protein